jgi:hypothetical protein
MPATLVEAIERAWGQVTGQIDGGMVVKAFQGAGAAP